MAASTVADPRLTATDARIVKWTRRRVVRAERRASQTESATAQHAHLALDQETRRESGTARSTDLHIRTIGTPVRADPGSPRRTRTSDPAITRSPRFPSDVDYLITVTVAGP